MTGWRVGYAGRAGGDPRGDRQGPPVRDHVGADDRPGRGARGARRAASPTSSGCVAEYDRRRRLVVDGLNAHRASRRSSRAARSTPSRGSRSTGLDSRDVHRAAARRGARRGRPGQRLRAVGRGPRPDVLRDVATSSSRRRSCGSGGSWTATGPALAERAMIEPPTGAASPAPSPAMAPGRCRRAGRPIAPGTLSTFLVTDIEGSTRLWEEQPRRDGRRLALHDALLRSAVEATRWHPWSRRPATACSRCSTEPVAAISAALDAQRALRDADWGEIGAAPGPDGDPRGDRRDPRRRLLRPGAQPLGPDPRHRSRRPDPALGHGRRARRRSPPGRRRAPRPGLASAPRPRSARAGVPGRRAPTSRSTSRRSVRSAPGARTCPSS